MSFKLTTLTILSGQTESAELDLAGTNIRGPIGLLIVSPATLAETVHLVISTTLAGNFGRLQSGGADVVLAAGKATQFSFVTGRVIKLKATGAVAADRTFNLMGNRFTGSL